MKIDEYIGNIKKEFDEKQLTDEELEVAKEYLLYRLEKETPYLLYYAKKEARMMMKAVERRIRRTVNLLEKVIYEQRKRMREEEVIKNE
jgi:hypothetical protein